jgi:uncharacterized protein (UPF0332 family)
MRFSWRDYISLAFKLSGKRARPYNPSARLRSVISRAYYGAFVKARNFLHDREGIILPNDSSVHNFVIGSFRASSQNQRVVVAEHLVRLRSSRNYADYEDNIFNLTQRVNQSLSLANQIINVLDRL